MKTNKGLKFEDFFLHTAQDEVFDMGVESIPGYSDWLARSAIAAASVAQHPTVLNVGDKKGQWGAFVQRVNPRSTIIDVNHDPNMLNDNVNPSSIKKIAAWCEGFQDGDTFIPAYEGDPVDVIHMSMVRQFVTDDTKSWYGEAAKNLKDTGVFMLGVKVIDSVNKKEEIGKDLDSLMSHFEYGTVVWDSSNFVGFFTSHDQESLVKAVAQYSV